MAGRESGLWRSAGEGADLGEGWGRQADEEVQEVEEGGKGEGV